MRSILNCVLLFVCLWAGTIFQSGCAKTGTVIIETTADSATQIIMAADEMNINYEIDQVVNEALLATSICNIASGDSIIAGNNNVLYNTISQTIIDTSHISDSALMRLTYYGKNADQTKGRSGTVTLQFARDGNGKIIPWKAPGAAVGLTFNQYEVVVLSNNKSVWINGTATVTNVSGGQLKNAANISLQPGDSLRDKVKANISFTYNDNIAIVVTWAWNIYQNRTFTMPAGVLTSTIYGDTAVNNFGGVATTGTTRFNYSFYTQLSAPLVQTIPTSFLLSQPVAGQKIIFGIPEPITITYGVDALGNVVQGGIPYGYKMTWVANGGQASLIEKY